ncbi:hypothetical protein H0A58_04585 [Alcaligenaceae bacterium]|nr:hypothetical protein [Alcaligenaceae bacterium]
MSDLQIGLILLGLVLILVVLVFNWFQDRRIRRQMQEHFPETQHDPLMGNAGAIGRREPGFGLPPDPVADPAAPDDDAEVDPATEVVIDIAFAQPVPTAHLQAALQQVYKVGAKPVRVFMECEGGGHRARLRPNEQYASVQLAVLLANRSGALTDIEWSQLWGVAQDLAERFDGSLEGPEQELVLQRAHELDAIFAQLDAQVGLTLRMNGTLPVDQVVATMQEVGFLPYDTQLGWMSDTGLPRFTVLFDGVPAREVQSAGVDRIDFLLDLPNSPPDEQAFSRMACVGRDLAARLDAILLDDQGRPLPEGADHAIDQQLFDLYTRLEQAGFQAGTERTIRVFS